jgi:hypothetical protein
MSFLMLMGSIAHRGTPFSNYSDTGGPTLARGITDVIVIALSTYGTRKGMTKTPGKIGMVAPL